MYLLYSTLLCSVSYISNSALELSNVYVHTPYMHRSWGVSVNRQGRGLWALRTEYQVHAKDGVM